MKKVHISFYGERSLFRNVSMPGTDVADIVNTDRKRAIYGIIGNMLGLWRDFDDPLNLDIAPSLKKWIETNQVTINKVKYPENPETRILGQHRYKNTFNYSKPGESGPKNLTYHWDVYLEVILELSEKGAQELVAAVRQPMGTPYLGQSNCPAQVILKNID